jgi:hypothetical protein
MKNDSFFSAADAEVTATVVAALGVEEATLETAVAPGTEAEAPTAAEADVTLLMTFQNMEENQIRLCFVPNMSSKRFCEKSPQRAEVEILRF